MTALAPVAVMISGPALLPAFVWPQQRKKCEKCGRCEQQVEGVKDSRAGSSLVMRCTKGPRMSAGMVGGSRPGYCIDMRTTGECGPGAALFEAAK